MKAMILAAGRGDRMRPLTSETPKPLMRIADTTLIEHALCAVKKAGINEVIINVHHLRDQIMEHCGDGSAYNLTIRYSIEETLLDTGGGIANALPLLGKAPFLVLSADVWTDFPLSKLMKKNSEAAHLVLVDNPDFHPMGDFGLDESGVVHNSSKIQFTYSNIAVLNPNLFANEKNAIFPLSRVLREAIAKGTVTGEYYVGEWCNVGTVRDLALLRQNYAKIRANQ